MARRQAAGS